MTTKEKFAEFLGISVEEFEQDEERQTNQIIARMEEIEDGLCEIAEIVGG